MSGVFAAQPVATIISRKRRAISSPPAIEEQAETAARGLDPDRRGMYRRGGLAGSRDAGGFSLTGVGQEFFYAGCGFIDMALCDIKSRKTSSDQNVVGRRNHGHQVSRPCRYANDLFDD
ncbi:MAG: hypothetical protein ACO1N5_10700 [Noviherbaspirillum sp.]